MKSIFVYFMNSGNVTVNLISLHYVCAEKTVLYASSCITVSWGPLHRSFVEAPVITLSPLLPFFLQPSVPSSSHLLLITNTLLLSSLAPPSSLKLLPLPPRPHRPLDLPCSYLLFTLLSFHPLQPSPPPPPSLL